MAPLGHQIRASQTADTITVYQAYGEDIAQAALRHQTFVAPFKRERMTWIKPSFLWMMYRSGWGMKTGQSHVLGIEISREGLCWALEHACLSHFQKDIHCDEIAWREQLANSPVRIQWDPERDIHLSPLLHRSIQIGLSQQAVDLYCSEWIVSIRSVMPLIQNIREKLDQGDCESAQALLPVETIVEVDVSNKFAIGLI